MKCGELGIQNIQRVSPLTRGRKLKFAGVIAPIPHIRVAPHAGRGTNENTNDILRFFFPKGFDFRTITQSDVDEVVDLINHRPGKCLNWWSPAEVFFLNRVALGWLSALLRRICG